MERFAFRFSIAPGSEGSYRRAHDEMSVELRRVYRDAGLHNYCLFIDGSDVFAFVESERDPVVALAEVAGHPLEVAFNRELEDVIVGLADKSGVPERLPEVWHLDD